MGSVKGQLGVESLLMYGFVIIIIGVILIYLSNLGIFGLHQNTCSMRKYGFSVLDVTDYEVYSSDAVQLSLKNMGSSAVNVTDGQVIVGGAVECLYTDLEKEFEPGQTHVLTFFCDSDPKISNTYSAGSCYSAEVVLSIKEGNRERQTRGEITGKVAI